MPRSRCPRRCAPRPALRGIVPGPGPWPGGSPGRRLTRRPPPWRSRGRRRHAALPGGCPPPSTAWPRARVASSQRSSAMRRASAHGPLGASVGDGASGAAWLAPFVARPFVVDAGLAFAATSAGSSDSVMTAWRRAQRHPALPPRRSRRRSPAGRSASGRCRSRSASPVRRPAPGAPGTRGPTVGGVGPVSRKAGSAAAPGRWGENRCSR